MFRNIVAAMDSTFKGGVYTLEAANDGITYAPFHDAEVPEGVATKMEETRKPGWPTAHRHRGRPGHRHPELSNGTARANTGPARRERAGPLRVAGALSHDGR